MTGPAALPPASVRRAGRRAASGVLATALALLAASGAAQNPYPVPHASWVSLSGRVARAGGDDFRLDFGAGEVVVDLGGWDRPERALPLRRGERATVHGRFDRKLLDERRLVADAIYLPERDAHYFARDGVELSGPFDYPFLRTGARGSWLTVTGTVERLGPGEFTVDVGDAVLVVETPALRREPAAWLARGDRVSASGEPGPELFQAHRLRAATVAKLDAGSGAD